MRSFLFFFAFVILLPVYAFSQHIPSSPDVPLEYFDRYWYRVPAGEQAVYIRAYMGYDSAAGLSEIRDFKAGGVLIAAWHYSPGERYIKEGPAAWFRENQQPERKGQYAKGKRTGQWTDFYRNGQRKKQYTYAVPDSTGEEDKYLVDNSWDSTGKAEVINGYGLYRVRNDSSGALIEKGMVKKGLREGIWEGFDKDGRKIYEDEYTNGTFIKGTRYGEGAACIVYDSLYIAPVFPGGQSAMMRTIYRTVRYPREAIDMDLEGTVIVGFTIDKTGQVTDVAVHRGVSASIDKEAMRVVGSMPPWIPGVQRGKPVAVAFRLPIKFALTSKK